MKINIMNLVQRHHAIKISIMVLCVVVFFYLLYGCAFKSYDPNNPADYYNYWGNKDNIRYSPVYPFTSKDFKDEIEGR